MNEKRQLKIEKEKKVMKEMFESLKLKGMFVKYKNYEEWGKKIYGERK